MVNYSQSTAMSRGGFAPNVQYSASVRMPTQPIPELKQPDSKFNIDLAGLGRGLAQAAYQERLAQKEERKAAKEQYEHMLKVDFAKEANLIQMGVDQGAYTAEAGQIKSRALSDRYLSYGMDPDELFPIYENAVSPDVRDIFSNRRKVIETKKNEVRGKKIEETITAIPGAANWSEEQIINFYDREQRIGDELALAVLNGDDVDEVSERFMTEQGITTVYNLLPDIQAGRVSGEEGKRQTLQSTVMAYAKKNPNMSASEIMFKADKNLARVNNLIDITAAAKQGEQKLVADRLDTLVKQRKLTAMLYLPIEDQIRLSYGLVDPIEDRYMFGPRATEVGVAAVTSPDGRTTTAQKQFLVRDISGNQMMVTAADSKKAIETMNNASQRVYPEGSIATPLIKQAIPQGYTSPNVSVQGFTKLSDTDVATLAENRKSTDAIAGSVNMRNTFKNDAETIQYVDNQSSVTAGLLAYKDVPGVKEIVQDNDNYVRALKGNEVMLANTRINSEGYLVAATDVQGVLGTMQQYLTGAKYRNNLDQINNNLSRVSPMHRKNVAKLQLESYGLSVKDYDPAVDGEMSSIATPGERAAQNAYEVVGKAWEYGDKSIRKFDEKVFTPLQNKIEEIITPYLDEAVNNAPSVMKDLKGGEGTYLEYLKDNVKEATQDFTKYIIDSIESYKALQAGKDAPGLEDIVNKPEEPAEPADSGDNLNDFLSTIKYYADPSHYEIPEIRLDKVIATEEPTTMIGKAAKVVTDDEKIVKVAEGIGKIRESAIDYIKEQSANVLDKGEEVAEDVIDVIDIVGRTAAYNELAPKLGMSKALEVSLGNDKGKTTRLEKGWTILQGVLGKTTEKVATKTKDIVLGTIQTIYDYLTEEVSVRNDEPFESYLEHFVNTKLYDLPEQYEIEYEEDPSKIELFPRVKSIKKNR